jgi:hypothetical protein
VCLLEGVDYPASRHEQLGSEVVRGSFGLSVVSEELALFDVDVEAVVVVEQVVTEGVGNREAPCGSRDEVRGLPARAPASAPDPLLARTRTVGATAPRPALDVSADGGAGALAAGPPELL